MRTLETLLREALSEASSEALSEASREQSAPSFDFGIRTTSTHIPIVMARTLATLGRPALMGLPMRAIPASTALNDVNAIAKGNRRLFGLISG